MKRFMFSLQKLLSIRTFYEKEAETNLGRAVAARDAIVLRLTEVAQEAVKTRSSLRISCISIDILNIHENYLERLHKEREKLEAALAEAELTVDKMRKLYIKAHQDRVVVSKLRERKELQWHAEELRQQDALLDDLINAREYKKGRIQLISL